MKGIGSRQRGVTLIVVAVILLIGSLVASTTMKRSVFEEKLTGNLVAKEVAFRAAESVAVDAFSDDSVFSQALAAPLLSDGSPSGVSVSATWPDNRLTVSGQVFADGASLARGFSIGAGTYRSLSFRATGTAIINNNGASSNVLQGASRLAPAR